MLTGAALSPAPAQNKTAGQAKPAAKEKPAPPAKTQNKTPTPLGASKTPTAEQVAETVVFAYGSRGVLDQIRHNGVERGRVTRTTPEGRIEESSYERRFIRGADSTKDRIRVDQKMPNAEYSLVYGGGRLWGIINGSSFTPRQDAIASFMSQYWHSIDALLRFKENGSIPTYIDRIKQKGLDIYVIDITDKEKRRTRYYISAKTLRVLWLEYEEVPDSGGTAVKYTRKFSDYRPIQNTLLAYHSVLLADDKQVQETHILSVTFGLKIEDSIFHNPDSQANANP
jgi:hypothetical protein